MQGKFLLVTLLAMAAVVILVLASCAPFKAVPHEGAIENGSRPQLIEQCKAQPKLDWCHHAD